MNINIYFYGGNIKVDIILQTIYKNAINIISNGYITVERYNQQIMSEEDMIELYTEPVCQKKFTRALIQIYTKYLTIYEYYHGIFNAFS